MKPDIQKFKRLSILYGSETGNCQDLSKIIAWTLFVRVNGIKTEESNNDFEIRMMSCDEFDICQLPNERLILFVCSTTGVGEEPFNMKQFWRFLLRRDLPSDSLSSLSFAVIGLGDSSYLKYNFVAKKLYKRLLNLGATALLNLVLGDDQHELGPYAKIDPWLQEFYSIVLPHSDRNGDFDILIEPSFNFTFLKNENENIDESKLSSNNSKKALQDALNPYEAKVIENKRLTSEDYFQDVRLLSLKIDDNLSYNLGDVCCVYPENTEENVQTFLSLFEDEKIRNSSNLFFANVSKTSWVQKSSFYHHLFRYRQPCSVHELVKNYLDFNSIPKRSFFYLFYHFSRDKLEKDLLKRFALGTDLDELYDYVNRPRRTILEVMLDFPHTTPYIPFEYFLDLIPAISPRSYSIASSPLVNRDQIDIFYAVVNFRTRLRKPRIGLCTNWLSKLTSDHKIRVFLRPSNFKLPVDHTELPLIMVGAGTGVAPFRAFIHHRAKMENIDKNWLFFGCRYRNHDYYFEDEWRPLSDRRLLTVFEAFSREKPDGSKVYVQHRMWNQRELLFRLLIKENGILWIAGKSQQYPQLIRETIVNILKEHIILDNLEHSLDEASQSADKLVNQLELRKRIQFECW